MARITPELARQIERLTKKYSEMLCTSCPTPEYQIQDNITSNWLGLASWWANNPQRTVIKFQKRIVDDPKTFERIFAHEWIHHVNYMTITAKDIAYLRAGIKQDGHGAEFMKYADIINSHMGAGFVTPKSDNSHVKSESGKTINLLIVKVPRKNGIAWSWNVRMTPKVSHWINRRLALGDARLLQVKDDHWTIGVKLDGYGKQSLAREGEEADKLLKLYEAAPDPRTVEISFGTLPSAPA
jgi:SprT-like family protein